MTNLSPSILALMHAKLDVTYFIANFDTYENDWKTNSPGNYYLA
jgi:hypothetical protein